MSSISILHPFLNMRRNMSIFSVFLIASIPLALCMDTLLGDLRPLSIAIEEMQRANYFAFIVLLNMAPPDKISSNVTFLMPNNQILSKTIIPKDKVLDFLLRHSIPTTISFDALRHFPTGSMVPSSKPGFMLNVSNNGWRNFSLNNNKIVKPNVCVSGSSIRCHGIDTVLNETLMGPSPTTPNVPPPLGPPSVSGACNNPSVQPVSLNPSAENSGSAYGGGVLEYLSKLLFLPILLLIFY